MKITKKFVASICLAVLLLSSFASSAFASNQGYTELIQSTIFHYKYGYVSFSGDVEVANIGYQKNVTIHYTTGNGQWYDTPASYVEPTDSTHEKWSFGISTSSMSSDHPELKNMTSIQFAIKYEVNGQTYWNNNNGQNYSVASYGSYSVILDKPTVLSIGASLYSNSFSVSADLKNLGYAKVVKVHYTTDNWQTVSVANLSYSTSVSPTGAVERWSSYITVNPGVTQIKYAISYEVNGQTYWDNNYGKNYTVNA